MKSIRPFARFWWRSIFGDDWRIAAGLTAAFGLCALLAQQAIDAWWLLPIAALALLAESLHRAIRRSSK